jgi:hypothetical protein
MRNNRFWRISAVCAIIAVLYLGHGLHSGPSAGLPLISSAQAGGIISRGETTNAIFTTSEDGKTVYVWHQTGPWEVQFAGSAHAK